MQDLMYFGQDPGLEKEFIRESKEKFPDVKFEDAYDDIKGYRQEVSISEDQEDDFKAWMLAHGWLDGSLNLSLLFMQENCKEEALALIALAKKQYPDNFKKDDQN